MKQPLFTSSFYSLISFTVQMTEETTKPNQNSPMEIPSENDEKSKGAEVSIPVPRVRIAETKTVGSWTWCKIEKNGGRNDDLADVWLRAMTTPVLKITRDDTKFPGEPVAVIEKDTSRIVTWADMLMIASPVALFDIVASTVSDEAVIYSLNSIIDWIGVVRERVVTDCGYDHRGTKCVHCERFSKNADALLVIIGYIRVVLLDATRELGEVPDVKCRGTAAQQNARNLFLHFCLKYLFQFTDENQHQAIKLLEERSCVCRPAPPKRRVEACLMK